MSIPDININILNNPSQASKFWEWLTHRPKGYVAIDTETGAAGAGGNMSEVAWYKPGFHVRMLQFGDAQSGWAIPFQEWKGMCKGALDWCSESRTKIVGHNIVGFDALALRAEGITLDPTVLQDTFIYAGLGGYAEDSRELKPLGVKHLGQWVGAGQTILKRGMDNAGWTWTTVPWDWKPYPLYGVVDVVADSMLYEKWEPWRKQFADHHDMEIATSTITNDMSWHGITVDGEVLQKHILRYDEMETELLAQAEANHWDLNDRAAKKYLKDLGLLDESRKSAITGEISLDKKQLVKIDHPLAELILQLRKVRRVKTNYLEDLLGRIGGELGKGVVHPSIWSMAAKTGRMSVSAPPLQQMPSGLKDVREAFVADNEDEVLVGADFGQIELRIWASINKDQALLDVLNEADRTGEDFFVMLGRDLFNDPNFIKSDPRRQIVKPATYGILFTAGDDTIAETSGQPLKVVTPITQKLKRRYPSMANMGLPITNPGEEPGSFEVWTPYGRRFRVHSQDERRKLPNYATQGHAAEIIKRSAIGCRAAGLGPFMRLPVHDELIMSVPRNDATEAAQIMKEVMNSIVDPEQYGVAVKASPSIGTNWSELK